MTKKITCPHCGNPDIEEYYPYHYVCYDCVLRWSEGVPDKIAPVITPEMAWDQFCKQVFASDTSIGKVRIHTEIGVEPYVSIKYCTEYNDTWAFVLGHITTKALGWQDMPERGRND